MEESKLLKNIRNISKKKKIPLYVIEEKAGIAKGSISKWNDATLCKNIGVNIVNTRDKRVK